MSEPGWCLILRTAAPVPFGPRVRGIRTRNQLSNKNSLKLSGRHPRGVSGPPPTPKRPAGVVSDSQDRGNAQPICVTAWIPPEPANIGSLIIRSPLSHPARTLVPSSSHANHSCVGNSIAMDANSSQAVVDYSPLLLRSIWSLFGFATLFVWLRVYARLTSQLSLWWDDHFVNASWVSPLPRTPSNAAV